MSSKYIICCNCGDTARFSHDAFQMLFPNEEVPETHLQPRLYDLVDKLDKGTNFYRYVMENLMNNKTKYSYYFEVENGDIVRQVDLLTGKDVQC